MRLNTNSMNTYRKTNNQVAQGISYHRLDSIHVGSRTELMPEEIVMISAEISYSYIHLRDGRKIIVSTNIQKLQERLLGIRYIVRVHRSYMINISYLRGFDKYTAELRNDLYCPISRRKKINLENALNF